MFSGLLYVMMGGALGAGGRYLVYLGLVYLDLGRVSASSTSHWATLSVNVLGSFFMGLLIAYMINTGENAQMRLFLATGILGGFTTFSAFSLDAVKLLQTGNMGIALLYIALSVILSLAALWLGFSLLNKGSF